MKTPFEGRFFVFKMLIFGVEFRGFFLFLRNYFPKNGKMDKF